MSRSPDAFLGAASRIGRALVRSAYWDADRRLCNWVGRSTRELTEVGAPLVPTVAALGADVYGGCAGVALFLAQLAAVSGDEEAKSAALGASANALRNAERLPTAILPALSFHGGLLGVAFSAHRVAALIDAPDDLAARANALLDRVADEATAPHLFDVIGGNAGAIPALLALARSLPRPALLDLAVALGEELLEAVERKGEAWSWPPDRTSGPDIAEQPLTGLAHGASGLGLALLELHAATGRDDFLEAGRGAFAYEDALFDEAKGNWPDLRKRGPGQPSPTSSTATFAIAWCHGAPGIALARARASTLDSSHRESHRAVARTALATILATVGRLADLPRVDASLCHGSSGLAEIALTVGRWLGEPSSTVASAAMSRMILDRHSAAEDWPTGLASGGPNPSLLLGTAGIGLHLLRQHDPGRVPTPLWVVP